MKKDIAEKCLKTVMDFSSQLDSDLLDIKENCDEEEFKKFRKAYGKVMGYAYMDIMVPILNQYPDLKPDGLNAIPEEL